MLNEAVVFAAGQPRSRALQDAEGTQSKGPFAPLGQNGGCVCVCVSLPVAPHLTPFPFAPSKRVAGTKERQVLTGPVTVPSVAARDRGERGGVPKENSRLPAGS